MSQFWRAVVRLDGNQGAMLGFWIACALVAGCSFDGGAALSTLCIEDSDCTGGRVCSAENVCVQPGTGERDTDLETDVGGEFDVTPDLDVDDPGLDVDPDPDVEEDTGPVEPDVEEDTGPVEPDVEEDTGPVEPECVLEAIPETVEQVKACQDWIVFVSPAGAATGDGTMAGPVNTILRGLELAETSAGAVGGEIRWVLVAKGEYVEAATISLQPSVALVGGYVAHAEGWHRTGSDKSVVKGHNPTIRGEDIDKTTVLAHLEVGPAEIPPDVVSDALAGGRSVVTVYLKDSPGVELRSLEIRGGMGGDGAKGRDGAAAYALPGMNASGRNRGEAVLCADGQRSGRGGNGGQGGVRQDGERGGRGILANTESDGGVPGGAGGRRSYTESDRHGDDGSSAGNVTAVGATGAGGGEQGGFTGVVWNGKPGEDGAYGIPGDGGGGGGGGAGRGSGNNNRGGAGGGGGSGGCGGDKGAGGKAGGASVALLLGGSSAEVKIENCVIHGGRGGAGGDGGQGGQGAQGGRGAQGAGGEGNGNAKAGDGGNGGRGGNGGNGGRGGGGAGGPAFGIYSDQALRADADYEVVDGSLTGGAGGNAGAEGAGASGMTQAVQIGPVQ